MLDAGPLVKYPLISHRDFVSSAAAVSARVSLTKLRAGLVDLSNIATGFLAFVNALRHVRVQTDAQGNVVVRHLAAGTSAVLKANGNVEVESTRNYILKVDGALALDPWTPVAEFDSDAAVRRIRAEIRRQKIQRLAEAARNG